MIFVSATDRSLTRVLLCDSIKQSVFRFAVIPEVKNMNLNVMYFIFFINRPLFCHLEILLRCIGGNAV